MNGIDFFRELDQRCERWNALRHPFYQAWTRGELSLAQLGSYSGQYRHAVVALADAATAAADQAPDPATRAGLEAHAAEERAHVELWDRFSAAIGAPSEADPMLETERCVRVWAGEEGRSFPSSLATMYAIESPQPEIARTKRDGLIEHFGFLPESDATAYFDLHLTRDVEHAASHRAELARTVTASSAAGLIADAEAAAEANWKLLDGVERQISSPDLVDTRT